MTAQNPMFTDEQLRAYLDGQVSEDLRVQIDAALEADDDLCERLAALDEWKDALVPAFAQVLASAPALAVSRAAPDARATEPPASSVRTTRPPGGVPWWAAMAASFAFAAGGAMLGRLSVPGPVSAPPETVVAELPKPPPGWNDAVAAYTRLYTRETYSGLTPSAEQTATMLAAAGGAVGLDLSRAAQVDGLSLRHTEILALDGKPLIKLGYSDVNGEPVTVCVLLRPNVQPDGKPVSFRTARSADQNVVLWDVQPRGFLVIGRQDEAALRAVAEAVSAQL